VIVITNQAEANLDRYVLAAFDLRQKTRSNMLRRLTNRFLAALAVASAAIVLAPNGARSQQAPAAPVTTAAADQVTAGGELEKVTVTGYLIPRVGGGPQPVFTLDQDFITKQSDQTINDVLNRYPGGLSQQNAMTFAGNSNSPASSAYGLRALPANDTLVLIDGYRFPSFPIPINSAFNFVDINSIPLAAVERIEILKDGGSATYGSDAVAGVVNVITKDTYNGADIVNYFGISQRGDFEVYHGSLTAGLADKPLFGGKFSIVTAFDYYSQSPIESVDRWYAYGDRSKLSPNYPNQPVAFFPANGNFTGNTTLNTYQVKPGTTGPNITANDFTVNGPAANTFIPIDSQLAARETRYGGVLNASYSPTDWLKFYDRFIIQRNEENTVTPNQGFSAFDGIVIPANNPFNPFGESLTPNGQLEREFGPWSTDVIIRTLRNIVGGTVQLPHDWFIDGNFLYGESDSTQYVYNAINKSRLQQALNGTLPGFPGVFFNPFTDQNLNIHPNQQFYDALRTEQVQNNRTDIVQWTLKAGGTVIELCSGPLTVAGGFEYRSESLIQGNDMNSEFNNITSADFPGHLLSARRYIKSLYGEVDLPLAGEKWSWPGLRNLDVVFSERYDNYSDFGDAEKPKIAVRYKPFDDLTFRGSYSEGFIAPTLGELFASPLQFQSTITDPLNGQTYNVTQINGGNPNLQPQTSYGYYLEAIWTPGSGKEDSWWHWAKGFTGYVDWYQIDIRNEIGTIPVQTLIGAPGAFPGTVIRGGNGLVQEVIANYRNLGSVRTDGIDFGASYLTKEYNWGKLDVELNATYIYKYSRRRLEGNADGSASFQVLQEDDSLGFGGPDLKFVGSLFYSKHLCGSDNFRTGFTLNYIDSQADGLTNFHGTLPAVDAGLRPAGFIHEIGSWTTVDWQISYEFGAPAEVTPESPQPGYDKDGKRILGEKAISPKPEGSRWNWRTFLANTTVTFGINNIADTRPPLQVAAGPTNFFQGFDTTSATPIQRYFYFQIEKRF
jgi:iron complex outermembrane recepter protein